jgi:hypothetical protein
MTTLFLRFVLSDLFVHGVGGGLYDSVTDEIASRLWGLTPPKMIVASATLHLPVVEPAGAVELDERKLNDQLRWLRSSPERFLDLRSPTAQSLSNGTQIVDCEYPKRACEGRVARSDGFAAYQEFTPVSTKSLNLSKQHQVS